MGGSGGRGAPAGGGQPAQPMGGMLNPTTGVQSTNQGGFSVGGQFGPLGTRIGPMAGGSGNPLSVSGAMLGGQLPQGFQPQPVYQVQPPGTGGMLPWTGTMGPQMGGAVAMGGGPSMAMPGAAQSNLISRRIPGMGPGPYSVLGGGQGPQAALAQMFGRR